jgi:hypothetical protein
MRSVFAEMVVDGGRERRRRQAVSGCASGLEHSGAAGFHSVLLYKISALCLLKAFAHVRAIARIRLHRRRAALLTRCSGSVPAWSLKAAIPGA